MRQEHFLCPQWYVVVVVVIVLLLLLLLLCIVVVVIVLLLLLLLLLLLQLIVMAIALFVIFPLNLAGTLFGRNISGQPNVPCRINTVPRPLPVKKWYSNSNSLTV